jgi:urease gamma subunit
MARSSLQVLNRKIDRKQLSLAQQTLAAERRMKTEGGKLSRTEAMAQIAEAQIARQERQAKKAPAPAPAPVPAPRRIRTRRTKKK